MNRLAALVAGFSLVASSSVSFAATLPVKAIKATSTLPEKDGEAYVEAHLTDGKAGSYWAEGQSNAGMGTVLSVDFPSEVTLSRIEIWNGCWQSADLWKRLYRVKDIEIKYPDFSYERLTIPDGQQKQVVSLKTPKKVNNIKIVIKSVYNGTTFLDTAISEMRFLDDAPESVVTGVSGQASSTLPPEKDNLDKEAYGAVKVVDGFIDTYWCEGKTEKGPAGQGIGEWVRVDLGGSQSVRKMKVAVGNGYDEKTYRQNSRATGLKADFSDGTSKDLSLEDRPGWQEIDLGGTRSLSWVKLTVTQVVEGTRWQDTAIADVQFVK